MTIQHTPGATNESGVLYSDITAVKNEIYKVHTAVKNSSDIPNQAEINHLIDVFAQALLNIGRIIVKPTNTVHETVVEVPAIATDTPQTTRRKFQPTYREIHHDRFD